MVQAVILPVLHNAELLVLQRLVKPNVLMPVRVPAALAVIMSVLIPVVQVAVPLIVLEIAAVNVVEPVLQ